MYSRLFIIFFSKFLSIISFSALFSAFPCNFFASLAIWLLGASTKSDRLKFFYGWFMRLTVCQTNKCRYFFPWERIERVEQARERAWESRERERERELDSLHNEHYPHIRYLTGGGLILWIRVDSALSRRFCFVHADCCAIRLWKFHFNRCALKLRSFSIQSSSQSGSPWVDFAALNSFSFFLFFSSCLPASLSLLMHISFGLAQLYKKAFDDVKQTKKESVQGN